MEISAVSVDDGVYRMARVRAAKLDTSVSAVVRDHLAGVKVSNPFSNP